MILPLPLLLSSAACTPQARQDPARVVISDERTYDTRPSAVALPDGGLWTVWIGYRPDQGECLLARRVDGAHAGPIELVDDGAGDYFQPVAVTRGADELWAVYGRGADGEVDIFARLRKDGTWQEPVQISSAPGLDLDPCAVATPDGRLVVAWEAGRAGDVDVHVRTFDGANWSAETPVFARAGNDWDPALACDGAGRAWVAWSGFDGERYRVLLAPAAGDGQAPIDVSAGGVGHALHPALATAPDGALWIAWDEVHVPQQGSSKRRGEELTEAALRESAAIRTRRFDGVRLADFAGLATEQGVVERTPSLAHGGFPRLAFARGELFLTYRAIGLLKLNRAATHDLIAQRFRAAGASPPLVLDASDGPLEAAAVVAGANALVSVVFQNDHKREGLRLARQGSPRAQAWGVREGWLAPLGWDADIAIQALRASSLLAATDAALPTTPLAAPLARCAAMPVVPTVRARSRDGERQLVQGDLHKHSSVSRCSCGEEPDPETYYHYAVDVLRDDFFALTDHVEHSNLATWWMLEKLVDAYRMPGRFETFHGFEWTRAVGHRNAISPQRVLPHHGDPSLGVEGEDGLWKALEGKRVLLIPHHTAEQDLSFDFDHVEPSLERVIEVFQAARGSFECAGCPQQGEHANAESRYVWDGLARGHKFGFIASTDHGYGASYAAVWSKSTSREDVFDALRERRCFATTCRGIVLETWIDGQPMGAELELAVAPTLTIRVESDAPLQELTVIKDARIVATLPLAEGARAFDGIWTDPDSRTGTSWYYVRVARADGELAWASPIWVTTATK